MFKKKLIEGILKKHIPETLFNSYSGKIEGSQKHLVTIASKENDYKLSVKYKDEAGVIRFRSFTVEKESGSYFVSIVDEKYFKDILCYGNSIFILPEGEDRKLVFNSVKDVIEHLDNNEGVFQITNNVRAFDFFIDFNNTPISTNMVFRTSRKRGIRITGVKSKKSADFGIKERAFSNFQPYVFKCHRFEWIPEVGGYLGYLRTEQYPHNALVVDRINDREVFIEYIQ